MEPVIAAQPADSAPAEVDFSAFRAQENNESLGRQPKPEESAPQPKIEEPSAPEVSEETEDETAADSEPAKPQEKRKSGTPAAQRVQELLAERAADRRIYEQKIKDLEARLTSPQPPPKQESAPAKLESKRPAWTDVKPDGTPKYAGENAMEDYIEDVADWKSGQKLDARAEQIRNETLAEFESRMRQQEAQKGLQQKLTEGRERYKDLDAKIMPVTEAIVNDMQINPAVKEAISSSPYMVDLLYVLGSDPAALEDFKQTARQDPLGAIRKAVMIEAEIARELKGQSGPEKPPVKKITQAPPPPHQVSGTATAGDEAEEAFKSGDFNSFRNAENRRELAARKGK
jgi:hypothetical protein